MVKRLADKPFTLLGINSDSSRSAFKKTIADEKITWPNIYGGSPSDNKISKTWNVYFWPTIYVIDHEGVIRRKISENDDLEKVVDELLAKVPK